MHTLDKVFCHSSIDNNMRSDPISHKKLLKGDAASSTCKKILGWLIDTVAMTVTFPLEKVNKVVSQLRNCLCLKRLGYKRVQKLLGLLRSVVSAIPGGLGLFTILQFALSRPRRIRMNDTLHDELNAWLSLVQDLHLRPTHMQEIIPPPPTWFGAHDACKHGLGGVFLSSVSHVPIIWRCPIPLDL